MKADVHPRQSDRLKTLYSYEILDTDREVEFDEVVALAASICGTSISVINLIDAERQWFKAEVGLGARETPLETSICSHIILQEEFVEIRDTLADPRMRDNPLCAGDPGLRFYAGALLQADDGLPIGTLCVLNPVPMALTPLQRDALRVLAKQVMNQLNLRRSLKTAAVLRDEVNHRVKNSLQVISSLTRIQIREMQGDEAKSALQVVQRRIESVASLHELLYRTDAGDRIELADFMRNLAVSMRKSAPEDVEIEHRTEATTVNSSQAAALGIIVNEFVTNSFKHAFPNGRAGIVRFRIDRTATGTARLICSDDGIGLSDAARGLATGFGLKILDASAAQLGGDLVFEPTENGTSITVEFAPLA